jgi:two-component system, OmpR family, sensor histidine kinase KdpD
LHSAGSKYLHFLYAQYLRRLSVPFSHSLLHFYVAVTTIVASQGADLTFGTRHMTEPGQMVANAFRYMVATLACIATTLIAVPLSAHLEHANIIMLYLLAVVGVALYLGRGPSIWAAFLSVACFDFFFVPPLYLFTVEDPQYLLTFAVMLAVALIIGQLTASLRRQADVAAEREREANALYEMARELAGPLDLGKVTHAAGVLLRKALATEGVILLPDPGGHLIPADRLLPQRLHIEPLMASMAYKDTACTDTTHSPVPASYVPLKSTADMQGVWVVVSPSENATPLVEHKAFLQTAASVLAIALERVRTSDALRAATA